MTRHLSGYRGILQVDGYGAYSKLVRKDGGNDGVTLSGCGAHSSRKSYKLRIAKSSKVATETVERMEELWEIEDIGQTSPIKATISCILISDGTNIERDIEANGVG